MGQGSQGRQTGNGKRAAIGLGLGLDSLELARARGLSANGALSADSCWETLSHDSGSSNVLYASEKMRVILQSDTALCPFHVCADLPSANQGCQNSISVRMQLSGSPWPMTVLHHPSLAKPGLETARSCSPNRIEAGVWRRMRSGAAGFFMSAPLSCGPCGPCVGCILSSLVKPDARRADERHSGSSAKLPTVRKEVNP